MVRREEQGEDGEHEQRDLDKMRERIGEERAVEDIRLRGRENNAHDGDGAAEGCEKRGDREARVRRALAQKQKIDGHGDQRGGDDDDLRQRQLQKLGVVDGVHCQPPWRRPSNSGEFRAGTMMFRSICG